jgi:hypothetical protein
VCRIVPGAMQVRAKLKNPFFRSWLSIRVSRARPNPLVEELRGRWWNRAYGRMARKDLWLWQDGSAWIVGARHGDSDAEVWKKSFDREESPERSSTG